MLIGLLEGSVPYQIEDASSFLCRYVQPGTLHSYHACEIRLLISTDCFNAL